MHFCTAEVLIGGDSRNVMTRDEFSPLSWPEIEILRVIHGDEAIQNVKPFASVEQTPRNERQRLSFIYGEGPVQQAWGGRNPPSEMDAPKAKIKAGTAWFNPLTGRAETTGKSGSEPVDAKQAPTAPMMAAEIVGDPRPGVVEETETEEEVEPPYDEPEPEPEPAPKAKKK